MSLVIALVVLPLLAIDLMLAALPPMTRGLQTSPAMGQVTLSVFAATFALMHLVYGPLADRFGRRPFALIGLALFCAASAVAALAPSIEVVLAARVVQGIGAATGPVLGRAVVRDLYGIEGSGRLMGFLMACFGVGAIVFPIVGGVLVEQVGWRAAFWFAAAFSGTTLLATWRYLTESAPKTDERIRFRRFFAGYWTVAIDARFVVTALPGCFTAAAMFTWISGSSFVVQTVLGYPPAAYGLIYGSTVLGFVATSLLTARLTPRTGSGRMIATGTVLATTGGIVGVLLSLGLPLTLPLLLIGIFLMTFGHGFTAGQSMAASIIPFPRMAATASALYGMIQYGTGALLSVLNGVLFDGTALPMLTIIAGITLTGAVIFWGFRSRIRGTGGI
jgi:DHA1 family bicyclomycin/chloramphenicol resistance-like MFS transporter